MVDAADSKSAGGDLVGVRVSPPAPNTVIPKLHSYVGIICKNYMQRIEILCVLVTE